MSSLVSGRHLNAYVCLSARDLLSPYTKETRTLGELIAERGHNLIWGGSDVGSMGVVSKAAFSAGGLTLGIASKGLANIEGLSKSAVLALTVDNLYRRIEWMESGADVGFFLPGGLGTLQELLRALFAIQNGSVQQIPLYLINLKRPDSDKKIFDEVVRHLDQMVRLGYLKPWVRSLVIEADSSRQAMRMAEDYYAAKPEAAWQQLKASQFIYTPEKDSVVYDANGGKKLLKHHELVRANDQYKPDLVGVLGSSIGGCELNSSNKGAFDMIGAMMETLSGHGKRVICMHSNRGSNQEIYSQALRNRTLAMSMSTDGCYKDGRLASLYATESMAVFRNPEKMAGFVKRRCGTIICFPGSDADIADVLCEASIDAEKMRATNIILVSPDGELDHMLNWAGLVARPIYAFGADGSKKGLASAVLDQVHIVHNNREMQQALDGIALGQTRRTSESKHSKPKHITTATNAIPLNDSSEAALTMRMAFNGCGLLPSWTEVRQAHAKSSQTRMRRTRELLEMAGPGRRR